MSETDIIVIEALTKVYQMGEVKVSALNGIDLCVKQGEFVAIMGPSGSGKSTLLNIIGCLDRPTSGHYWLAGEDVSQLRKNQLARIRNQKIGFVFQSYNLLTQATALQNVMLPLVYSRNGVRSQEEKIEMTRQAMAAVDLSDREVHKPTEMSGGQQQRVAIARALVNDPAIILADEPTGNLDSHSGQEIMHILSGLNQRGRTIVMITHDAMIASFAQREIHILDGRIDHQALNGRASALTEKEA
jgi:putative ABC transport system ATP-binding protein